MLLARKMKVARRSEKECRGYERAKNNKVGGKQVAEVRVEDGYDDELVS